MNPFKALGKAFGWVGHKVASVLHLVARLVTDEQVDIAIGYVRRAAEQQISNKERRRWVSALLQAQFHISESVANLLVELALQAVKRQLAEGVSSLDDILSDDADLVPLPSR